MGYVSFRDSIVFTKLHVHLQCNISWCQSEWWLTKPYMDIIYPWYLPSPKAPKSNRKIIFPTFLGSAGLVVGTVPIYIDMPSGCIQWGQHKEFGTLPWRPSCWKCYGVLVLGRKSPGLFRKKTSGWWNALPETNSLHLKMCGWNRIAWFLGPGLCSGGELLVSGSVNQGILEHC